MIFFRRPLLIKGHIHNQYVSTFNQTYFELLDIMKQYSSNQPKFPIFYTNNKAMRIAKPTLFIRVWHEYINEKYYDQIMNENIEYFLMKTFDGLVPRRFYVEYCVNKALQFMKDIYPELDQKHTELIKQKIKKLCVTSKLYYNNRLMNDL